MRNIISVVKQDALFSDFIAIKTWAFMDGRIADGWSMFLLLKFWRVCSVLIKKKNPEFSTNVSHCLTLNVFILLT